MSFVLDLIQKRKFSLETRIVYESQESFQKLVHQSVFSIFNLNLFSTPFYSNPLFIMFRNSFPFFTLFLYIHRAGSLLVSYLFWTNTVRVMEWEAVIGIYVISLTC